ncbi:MAG: hypothetical protein U9R14_01585 [Patescibacteria group bacterium]|nr:hypothetical protein [Patescibacteria group bacterium]
MKIAICGSLDFTYKIKKISDELKKMGFDVFIPISSEKILRGEFSLDEIKKEKENGQIVEKFIKYNSIRAYYEIIKKSDAILVVNFDKNNVKNYIGGAVLLEMGFAHILNKKIFLFNPLPENCPYLDEIKAMYDKIINGDLTKIK